MRSYWAEFAYSGDPGRGRTGELVAWTAWDDATPESPKYMVFDTEAGGGTRMSYEVYTKERIVDEIRADPRLPDWRERCEHLAGLAFFSGLYTREDYAAEPGCADWTLAAWPWPE